MDIVFMSGIAVGFVIMLILHFIVFNSYKRLLVYKSFDKSAEHINNKFYYIMEEKEYNRLKYLRDAGY